MPSNEAIETATIKGLPVSARIAQCLLAGLMLVAVNLAQAAPVTPAGFMDDSGDSYFTPGPGGVVLSVETLDAIDPLSEFGFFYRSTPGTLVPIFDGADVGAGQVALIDFNGGFVADVDSGGPLDPFALLADDIGFYFTIGGALTLHSDASLNALPLTGIDLFYSFQNIANPLQWALIFEGDLGNGLENISLNILNPLTPSAIPLPPTVYLMGSLIPILMFMSRRRRKLAVAAG